MKRDTIGLPHILLTCLHGPFSVGVIPHFTVCKQMPCKYVGKLCLHAVFSCANGWSSFRKEQLFLLLKAY